MTASGRPLIHALSVAVLAGLLATSAGAQVARVFLSGTGDDLNDCSNASTPCRSLQAAINQSPVNGEVIVLTSGGFGTASITKSVTINAAEGVVAFNARTIVINIAASDVVVIRGISMNGSIFGDSYGIDFQTGGTLVLEKSVVAGFSVTGLIQRAPGSNVIVDDCEFRNGNSGITTTSTTTAESHLTVRNSRLRNHAWAGVDVSSTTFAVVEDCVITGNRFGVFATGTTFGDPKVTVDHCVIAHNARTVDADGIRAQDLSSLPYTVTVRVTNTDIYDNNIGLFTLNAEIDSYGTNQLWNNATNGAFTATIAQQ
jgi:Right handed beta helix region